MKFKVREGFWLHDVADEPIGPGEIVELTVEQFIAHEHKLEEVAEAGAPKKQDA